MSNLRIEECEIKQARNQPRKAEKECQADSCLEVLENSICIRARIAGGSRWEVCGQRDSVRDGTGGMTEKEKWECDQSKQKRKIEHAWKDIINYRKNSKYQKKKITVRVQFLAMQWTAFSQAL